MEMGEKKEEVRRLGFSTIVPLLIIYGLEVETNISRSSKK